MIDLLSWFRPATGSEPDDRSEVVELAAAFLWQDPCLLPRAR